MRRFVVVLSVALAAVAPRAAGDDAGRRVVHASAGAFGTIYVVDEGPLRAMHFGAPDNDPQTLVDMRDPRAVPMAYLAPAALALVVVEAAAPAPRVLVAGLGGGGFLAVTDAIDNARVDAVEIDPAVVRVARSHFALDDRRLSRVLVDDARAHLARGDARGRTPYDFILVDAYAGDDYPRALAESAFFTLVAARLSPAGVVALNLALDDDEARPLVDRVERAFDSCLVVRVADDENLLVVASRRALTASELVARAAHEDARRRLPIALTPHARAAAPCRAFVDDDAP